MVTEVDALLERRINLYEVLQISSNASPEVVQAAYRALARAYHPDINPSPDAARKMRQLNAAYSVLSDSARRSRYDAVRVRPQRARGDVGPRPTTRSAPSPTRVAPRSTVARPSTASTTVSGPRIGGPRVGRLIAAVSFVFVLIGALVYALYLVAGALDDEPVRAMIPAPAMTQTFDATPQNSPGNGLLNRVSTEH